MKANELRIGNLVYFKHCDYEYNIPRKINYTLKPNLVGLEKVSVNRIEYNNIEPIPLTEEWLLKFGFNKDLDNDLFLNINSNSFLVWQNNNIELLDYENNKCICFCKYVHTLQNLYFALTSEELTIKQQEQ